MELNTQKPKGRIHHIQHHDKRYRRKIINRIASGIVIGFFLLIVLLSGSLVDILWALILYSIIFSMIWFPTSLGRVVFALFYLLPFTWLRDNPEHADELNGLVVVIGWIWLLSPIFWLMAAGIFG